MRGGCDDVLLARQRVLRFEDVITGTFADYVPKAKKTEKNKRKKDKKKLAKQQDTDEIKK